MAAKSKTASARKPAPIADDEDETPAPPSKKEPKRPLPDITKQALPVASMMVKHLLALVDELPQLERELKVATQLGPVALARAFVTLHRFMEIKEESLKKMNALYELYKCVIVPDAILDSGQTHVPLQEGYRVGRSEVCRASIRKGMKDQAYQWLRENGYPDLIKPGVNSSSLSKVAATLMEEENKEPPSTIFNVLWVPNTSVTQT